MLHMLFFARLAADRAYSFAGAAHLRVQMIRVFIPSASGAGTPVPNMRPSVRNNFSAFFAQAPVPVMLLLLSFFAALPAFITVPSVSED